MQLQLDLGYAELDDRTQAYVRSRYVQHVNTFIEYTAYLCGYDPDTIESIDLVFMGQPTVTLEDFNDSGIIDVQEVQS